MKEFLVIDFTLEPVEPTRDILLALLDNLGYDSFEESDIGLKAYITESEWDEAEMKELFVFQSDEYQINYTVDRLENKNWNEEWETFYDPIFIEDQVHIRASFHETAPSFPIELLIEPKMSFGTGHHQTTRLMVRLLLEMNLKDKSVLDMGTGTGVLAILAEKRGAAAITAIDNFDWAVENTAENANRNHCKNIEALLGDASILPGRHFDVVIANINRNVLLEDIKHYVKTLNTKCELLLSGFFEEDFSLINEASEKEGLKLTSKLNEGKWAACHYKLS